MLSFTCTHGERFSSHFSSHSRQDDAVQHFTSYYNLLDKMMTDRKKNA
ncbi:hypothetical protein HACA111877_06395 [Halomonas casei]